MGKGVHIFPKGSSSKGNVLAQPEFELSYLEAAVQHLSHYAIGTHPVHSWQGVVAH